MDVLHTSIVTKSLEILEVLWIEIVSRHRKHVVIRVDVRNRSHTFIILASQVSTDRFLTIVGLAIRAEWRDQWDGTVSTHSIMSLEITWVQFFGAESIKSIRVKVSKVLRDNSLIHIVRND